MLAIDHVEPSTVHQGTPAHRDHSIDWLRGLALIVILVDHIEIVIHQDILRNITLYRYGLSDGLDAFVFLSGFSFGIVHSRVQQRSFFTSQLKACQRAFALATFNCVVLICVLILSWVCRPPYSILAHVELAQAMIDPMTAISNAAILRFQPFGFVVLPLYVGILILAPSMLWIARRSGALALIVSVSLYLLALTFPSITPKVSGGGLWEFHPLAWQLVFFIGMLSSRGCKFLSSNGQSVSRALIYFGLFVMMTIYSKEIIRLSTEFDARWLIDKRIPGPIRLLHFLLLAGFTSCVVRHFQSIGVFEQRNWLCLVGRHSLPVYMSGLWLTYLAAFFMNSAATVEIICFEANAILLSIGVAWAFDHHRYDSRRIAPECK